MPSRLLFAFINFEPGGGELPTFSVNAVERDRLSMRMESKNPLFLKEEIRGDDVLDVCDRLYNYDSYNQQPCGAAIIICI